MQESRKQHYVIRARVGQGCAQGGVTLPPKGGESNPWQTWSFPSIVLASSSPSKRPKSQTQLPLVPRPRHILKMAFEWKAAGLTYGGPDAMARGSQANIDSYNRYLAIAARVVRRSLKEGPRLQAERRGEMDLRFAKWQVSYC
jgi:hypothetical protein